MTGREKLTDFYEDVKEYLNLRVQLLSLTLGEKASRTLASIASGTVIVFLCAMFLVFAGFAAAYGLGRLLGTAWGFSIVAGVYLIATVLAVKLRKKLEARLIDVFVKLLFKNGDDTDKA